MASIQEHVLDQKALPAFRSCSGYDGAAVGAVAWPEGNVWVGGGQGTIGGVALHGGLREVVQIVNVDARWGTVYQEAAFIFIGAKRVGDESFIHGAGWHKHMKISFVRGGVGEGDGLWRRAGSLHGAGETLPQGWKAQIRARLPRLLKGCRAGLPLGSSVYAGRVGLLCPLERAVDK